MEPTLFDIEETIPTVEDRIEIAKKAITSLFLAGKTIWLSFSGGKDSGVAASLVLTTAAHVVKTHPEVQCRVFATTSSTGVENPEIEVHFRNELAKMKAYAKKHGFTMGTHIATPTLASSWQLKVLSGRGLPSFPGQSSDCSVDLKVRPQKTLRRKLMKQAEAKGYGEAVTILGTRYEESERRAMLMALRQENGLVPVRNSDGDLVLSIVADWSLDHVWEYIGLVSSGLIDSYTDFEETKRIYAHSAGTSCAVVADALAPKSKGASSRHCGNRHGCFTCVMAEDKSLEAMIEYDARYAYARGLNKLNKFIRATRYDWNRRHWIGRTIKGGYIAIEPDTYHPKMVRELFRYMVQLDHDERIRAKMSGERVMFQIFSEEMILAVDAYWSLTGLALPFSAWADVRDITQRGIRYDIPDVETTPPQPMPATRFLYVGKEWDDSATYPAFTGMRDAYVEGLLEMCAGAPQLTETAKGNLAWDVSAGKSFSIDLESLYMLQDIEMERMLEMHERGIGPGGITEAYKFYLRYGVIELSYSQRAEHDEILRRTEHKHRLGLSCEYDLAKVLAMSVEFSELPAEARKLWAGKATTESAQMPMFFWSKAA